MGCSSLPNNSTKAQDKIISKLVDLVEKQSNLPLKLDQETKKEIYNSLGKRELKCIALPFFAKSDYIPIIYMLAGYLNEEEFMKLNMQATWRAQHNIPQKKYLVLFTLNPYREGFYSLTFQRDGQTISNGSGWGKPDHFIYKTRPNEVASPNSDTAAAESE